MGVSCGNSGCAKRTHAVHIAYIRGVQRKRWRGPGQGLRPSAHARLTPEYFREDENHARAARSMVTVARKPTNQISERQGVRPKA